MVMTPRIGAYFVEWPSAPDDRTLGVVNFSIFPHLDAFPTNTLADAERWAADIGIPAYAIDEQTAIKVVNGTVEVVSEGHWKSSAAGLVADREGQARVPDKAGYPTIASSRPPARGCRRCLLLVTATIPLSPNVESGRNQRSRAANCRRASSRRRAEAGSRRYRAAPGGLHQGGCAGGARAIGSYVRRSRAMTVAVRP